jgi:outer membrane protein TolC
MQAIRAGREVAAAEHARDNALGVLRRLLALPFDEKIELAGAPGSDIVELPSETDLVDRALRKRPDLTAFRHSVQRADLHLALTTRAAIPNITLSGLVSRFEGSTLVGGDVGVPLPIFQRKTAEIHEAVAEHDRTSLQVQDLEREIEKEVREAHRACVVAAGDLQAHQRDLVPKSEENLEIERRRYARGDVTVAELVGLQIDLVTARQEYLDALETYNTTLIELNRVTGGSLAAN